MRIKQSRLKIYYVRRAVSKKDSEKNTYSDYLPATLFSGVVWPASGKLQAEIYGQRLASIMNCKINGLYSIQPERNKNNYVFQSGLVLCEGDGVCVYVPPDAQPDYKVVSIKPYDPLYLELEKL